VRWADVTLTSKGISNFFKISKLASITGKSESEPIRIATKAVVIFDTPIKENAEATGSLNPAQ
jgi:hypothetical protein